MGEETYYIDYLTKFCDHNILDEEQKNFNKTVFYGKDSTISEIISVCKRYPINCDFQIVIIKEAQDLSRTIDGLSEYALNPMMSTILIINYNYKTLDKRKKLYTNIQKFGTIINCKKLYDNQIPEWITKYLKKDNYDIDLKASNILYEFLGNDLPKIENQLNKLKIVAKNNHITSELIENNIGFSKDYNVLELVNAVSEKNLEKSLLICHYISKNNKKHPVQVTVSLLFNFFIQIFKLHSLSNKSTSNISKTIGVNPYFVEQYVRGSKNYSLKKISRIVSLIRDLDMKTKGYNGSAISSEELLRQTIVQIIKT